MVESLSVKQSVPDRIEDEVCETGRWWIYIRGERSVVLVGTAEKGQRKAKRGLDDG